MSERVIIKVGGSLLSPYETSHERLLQGKLPFDIDYAEKLIKAIQNSTKKFVIIIGGGFLNRWILNQMNSIADFDDAVTSDKHQIGIASGIINASLFHSLAVSMLGGDQVYESVVKYKDYEQLQSIRGELEDKKLIIGSGKQPGFSHDTVALYFASLFGTNQVLSLKNVDGIYTGDPKTNPQAVKKKVLTWPEYRSIIHMTEHEPGASFPIDAVAAQLAEKMKVGFTVIYGRDFDAVTEAVETRLCSKGSVISPE